MAACRHHAQSIRDLSIGLEGLAGRSLTSGSWLPGCCPTRSWNAPTPACVTQPLSLLLAPGSKMSSTSLHCIPRRLNTLLSGTALEPWNGFLLWCNHVCLAPQNRQV